MAESGCIRVGTGGWSYEPWRETFYPADLSKTLELHHASRVLTAIEINSTFYRSQPRATFERWREETPAGFRFTVKAPRYATHRRILAEAGDAIARFMDGGVLALEDRLGPVLWQFPPAKAFDRADFERFLALLPRHAGVRHALEVRHPSFLCAEYVALARRHGMAVVHADSADYPSYADLSSDVVYARLMRSRARVKTGYPAAELDRWARIARAWAHGGDPPELPHVTDERPPRAPRDVYVFFIDGAKERAPAAARALIARIEQP